MDQLADLCRGRPGETRQGLTVIGVERWLSLGFWGGVSEPLCLHLQMRLRWCLLPLACSQCLPRDSDGFDSWQGAGGVEPRAQEASWS